MKWSELEKLLRNGNFIDEIISTDQTLIEQKKCKKKHSLSYAGKLNGAASLGIGVCYRCDSAEIFPEYSQNADRFIGSVGIKKAA